MDNSVNRKLENILAGMDKNKINQAKRSLEGFINTPEGRRLAQQLNGADRSKLINMFMSMNADDIKKKLNNADLSKLSGKDIAGIVNKLK